MRSRRSTLTDHNVQQVDNFKKSRSSFKLESRRDSQKRLLTRNDTSEKAKFEENKLTNALSSPDLQIIKML